MKTGRNDPCPCGSGKKYKKCCEAADQQKVRAELEQQQQQEQEQRERQRAEAAAAGTAAPPASADQREPSRPPKQAPKSTTPMHLRRGRLPRRV